MRAPAPAGIIKMAPAAESAPREGLQRLEKLSAQMGLEARPHKIKEMEQLAGQFVPLYERCTADLARREEALAAREAELAAEKTSIEAAKAELRSQEALARLGEDVGEINARDNKFKTSLLSSNEKTVAEIGKTGAKVAESENRLADTMQANQKACMEAIDSCDDKISTGVAEGVAAGVRVSLNFGVRCINQGTVALAACENNLALKLDDTTRAVSNSEDTVRGAVSSCEEVLLADGNQTREKVSSCEENLEHKLAALSSGGETLGKMLAALSSDMGGLKQEITRLVSSGQEDVVGTLSSHKQEMTSSVREVKNLVGEMGLSVAEAFDDDIAGLKAHIDSQTDSTIRGSVAEVKATLDQGLGKLSEELGQCQTELAAFMAEDRLKSVFAGVSRDDEVLQLVRDVLGAIPQPDTRLAEGMSEIKQMLEDRSRREGELETQLVDANKKIESVSADLEKSKGERDQLQAELDQLKTKLPQTPRRSDQDSGSDESSFDVSSEVEQEMNNLVDAIAPEPVAAGPEAPKVPDLQARIRDLEDELRRSAENVVSKVDLTDAMDKMFGKLSLREDQAAKIAELERDLQASARRALDAEQRAAALETAAEEGTGNRGRKRSRLNQDDSSSSEEAGKSMFKAMSLAVHKAMDEVKIRQADEPNLPMAGVMVRMTQAFAYPERKDRLLKFITGDRTGKLFCFGSLMFDDDPSVEQCKCNELEGIDCTECLSVRVLNANEMEIEFSMVNLMP
ncbi:hypothetical protein KVR01_013153 [Diaporthe batatas]|uniref:uncharacterized protein n=1 Tax=Diaporthe batatas TaxID=748121 RepID=UPI001D03AC45|nr:uncharacterized protein KVR01_013153 [Diaporthe batatas]KAG8156931.1 hypothetical protein KVR01_013153 [Diaporthe batatas]